MPSNAGHSQKICNPQPKKFFQVQTTRLAKFFELLTRSVALTGPEKFLHKATCNPAVFARTAWINLGVKVLMLNVAFTKIVSMFIASFKCYLKSFMCFLKQGILVNAEPFHACAPIMTRPYPEMSPGNLTRNAFVLISRGICDFGTKVMHY